VKAITLHRPWPFAIFHLPSGIRKDVENRSWKPPFSVLGERIAIHAGKVFDDDANASIAHVIDASWRLVSNNPSLNWWLNPVNEARRSEQGIIGTVIVDGWVHPEDWAYGGITRGEATLASMSRWFTGPYGWVLRDPVALPTPIPCRGAQGLWAVPDDVEIAIMAQVKP